MTEDDVRHQADRVIFRFDLGYWIETCCHIYDGESKGWIPFRLWGAQKAPLATIESSSQVVILKARQLGFSWLVLCYALHQMIFWPQASVLLFSKRDDEATELLNFRLQGIHSRLPAWQQLTATTDDAHEWTCTNGSRAMAFPTTGGRSYTGTLAIVDEADYTDLGPLLDAVQPTVDHGGKLILLSTADKGKPSSPFKGLYQGAKEGKNGYKAVFVPWHARPGRSPEWYESKKREILSRDGSLDMLHQEYPATDGEALAANSTDKRLPAEWLKACYDPQPPLTNAETLAGCPAIPGLTIYEVPAKDTRYAIGADPAQGNPTSDESAATVVEIVTGREVAKLQGKIEPATFADYLGKIAVYYHRAGIMVERNNHGHAVLLALVRLGGFSGLILRGHDDNDGWLSSSKGKVLLYDRTAEAIRDKAAKIRSFATLMQLQSIEGKTLLAPEGMHDDLADSFALAVCASIEAIRKGGAYLGVRPEDTIFGRMPAGVSLSDRGGMRDDGPKIDRMVL